ncbi:MAG TPA: SBBP repeat-containing protein, partial [Blastocatellia bacterium]
MKSSASLKRQTILFLLIVNLIAWSGRAGRISASNLRGTAAAPAGALPPASPLKDEASRARIDWTLGHQPVSFVENRGQIDPEVAYYVEGMGTRLYFTSKGVTFSIPQRKAGSDPGEPVNRWNILMEFGGARADAKPVGQDATKTKFSYFQGQRDQWKTGLHSFSRVVYRDLWPGIDLIYAGGTNAVKYEYRVKPGADPSMIQLAYRGGQIGLDKSGDLHIGTPEGGLIDHHPYSYQDTAEGRITVATDFSVQQTADSDTGRCGFKVGSYDRSKTLVIDPQTKAYSGFIGGEFNTVAFGIAVDSAGAAYVTGFTESDPGDGFPITVGPGLNFNENKEFLFWTCFVAKISPGGTNLEYCGYIDGAGHQLGSAIAIDSSGAAYVTGFTTSDQTTFPVTVGPKLTYSGDFEGPSPNGFLGDAFVAKVKPDGSGLDYCGYIGGSGDDAGYGIAVDSSGNAYVTGQTTSVGPSQVSGGAVPFPATVGPSLTNVNAPSTGVPDAFIAEVNAAGTGFVYAGFIGGAGLNQGLGVAVDSTGAAYLTGVTSAPASGFPELTVGPSLTFGGATDAFVAKVKPGGSGLVYCGYIGGSSGDEGYGIAVDSAGNAYVTGETSSDQTTFPVKVGPSLTFGGAESIENGFQTNGVGEQGPPELLTMGDAFVAKVNPTGSGLVYCGYIGGSGGDAGYRIVVDSTDSAIITGSTNSSPSTFPVTAATGQFATYSGGTVFGDAFIAKVMSTGEGLLYAGYLGGNQDDSAVGLAIDSQDNVYVAGGTVSPDFPVAVGPSLTFVSEFENPAEPDAFVAKITGLPAGTPPPPPTPDFSIAFSQPAITAKLGTKVSATIDITPLNGFTGKV